MLRFMQNNEVFKCLLSLTRLTNDDRLIELLNAKGLNATKSKIRAWRASPTNPAFRPMPDVVLAGFFEVLLERKAEDDTFFQFFEPVQKLD